MSSFDTAPHWRHEITPTGPGEWTLTVTNVSTMFAVWAPLGLKVTAHRRQPDPENISLKALGSTQLNPGESVDLALRVATRSGETFDPTAPHAKLTLHYLAWVDVTALGVQLELLPLQVKRYS